MGVSGVGQADAQGLAHWGPMAKVGKADSGDCGHCGKDSLKVLWGGADPISDICCTPPPPPCICPGQQVSSGSYLLVE